MAPSGSSISMKYIIFAAALIGTFQAFAWLSLSLLSILFYESVIEIGDIPEDSYGKIIYEFYLNKNNDLHDKFIIYSKTFNYFMYIYLVLSFVWLIASCFTLWAVIRGKWNFITKQMIFWSGITIAVAIIDIILMSLIAADIQKAHDLSNPTTSVAPTTIIISTPTPLTEETSTPIPITPSPISFPTTTSVITSSRGSSTPSTSDTTLFSSTTPTTVPADTTECTNSPSTITTTNTPETTISTTVSTDTTESTHSPSTITTTNSPETTISTTFSTDITDTITTTNTRETTFSTTISTDTSASTHLPTTTPTHSPTKPVISTTKIPETTPIVTTPFVPIVPTVSPTSTTHQDTSTNQYFEDISSRLSMITSQTVLTQTMYTSMGIVMSVAVRGYILWIVNVTFAIMLIVLAHRIRKMNRPTLLPAIDAYATGPRPFNIYEQTEIGNGHLNNAFNLDESIIFSPRQMLDTRTDNTPKNPLSNSNRSSINNPRPQMFNDSRPNEIARGPPPVSKLAKIGKSGGGRRTPPLNIPSPVLPSSNMPYIPDPDYTPPASPNSHPKSALRPRSKYVL